MIHTSGTGLLLWDDLSTSTYGQPSEKIYNDLTDIAAITAFPDQAPHRKTDKMVQDAGSSHGDRAKVAIVAPPTIYGIGRGPDNKRSHQLPELTRVTLEKGHGIAVNEGKAIWSNVHVHDLSDLYVALVENAAAGGSLAEWPGKPSLWGAEAYFFAEAKEHVWADIAELVAKEAKKQGFIETSDVKQLSPDEAGKLTPYGQAMWGCNSRSRAKRARQILKWDPKGVPIEKVVGETVEFEARKIGVKPGHAKVAAGDA